jgi:predicted transcriptional regulator
MRKARSQRDVPPPLEMLCLKALWSLGEGNVSQVREIVASTKPLAYTTVLTILERLARKNVVTRSKVGRAFVYTPGISRETMRRLALREFVASFFEGSEEQLANFMRRPETRQPPPDVDSQAGLDTALL